MYIAAAHMILLPIIGSVSQQRPGIRFHLQTEQWIPHIFDVIWKG